MATNEEIRQALAANPGLTDQQLVDRMIQFGVTPAQLQQATGRDVSGIRQAFGGAGGYTDKQVFDAVAGRVADQGYVDKQRIRSAAERYGISDEQLMRALPGYNPASSGLYSTEQSGLVPAISALQGTSGDISGLYNTATGYYQPYMDYGSEAARRQAALTGSLGPEEQQAAMSEYMTSPAFDFLQQQQERAQLRNAAALGGLGGGNVRQALAELNAGLYAQDFANQFARLGEIATRGYGAAGGAAGLMGQQAGVMSGLGQREALMRQQAGQQSADLVNQAAINQANAQLGLGQNISDIYGQGATAQQNVTTGLATDVASAATNQAINTANALTGMGGQASGVATQPMQQNQNPFSMQQMLTAGGDMAALYGMMFPGQAGIPNYVEMASQNRFPPRQPYSGQPTTLGGNFNFGTFSTRDLIPNVYNG